ncbi:MAG: SH3 domain-containing protein [Methyloceanibacter sp.]|nr:SH3 domain-containing protein [Methyloceanibacter sp.]
MAQPALKQDGISDEVLRLAEQLHSASPFTDRIETPKADHSASSLARRFAPDAARERSAAADPTVLPPVASMPAQAIRKPLHPVLSIFIGAVSATALVGGLMWLGGIDDLNLDRVFQDAGLVSTTAPVQQASAGLAIDVRPPRSSAPILGTDGDGKVRTAARPEVAPPLSSGFAVRAGETDRVEGLMEHGQKMIDVGYFAGARAYYRRAAEAGSGEAAMAVGATYDPDIIARMGVQGIKPDRTEAAKWYARAAGLGIADREETLRKLTETWVKEPDAPNEAGIMADATTGLRVSAPTRKPGAEGQRTQAVQDNSKPQRVASSRAAVTSNVRPQLLASNEEQKPGPLSMFVRAAAGLSAQEEWMEVARPVNVRKGPSSDAGSNKVALKGAKFRVVGREGNWVKVADPKTAQEGYIYKRFLRESSAP